MLLNMVAEEAEDNRRASAALIRESPDWLLGEIERLTEGPTLFAPARHPVLSLDVNQKRLKGILRDAHEHNPQDFETLLGLEGVGPATVRSLSLLAEIIFQAPPARRDPTRRRGPAHGTGPEMPEDDRDGRRWADYSHAHGGKDGTPFPVDRATYDRNIVVLTDAVRESPAGRDRQIRRLAPALQAELGCYRLPSPAAMMTGKLRRWPLVSRGKVLCRQPFIVGTASPRMCHGIASFGWRRLSFSVLLAVYVLSQGLYTVEPHEKAVVLRFGKYYATVDAGLQFCIPLVDQVYKVSIEEHSLRLPFGGGQERPRNCPRI